MSKQSMGSVYRFLEFLKRNTDKNHPATQAKLRELAGEELSGKLMGDKGTFSRRLGELADAFNRDEEGNILPKDEWRIIYQGYNKENANGKNGKIYYAHEVSDYEMDFLVQQIRQTRNLTEDEKASLEKRLTDALCSRYYEYSENALIREMPLKSKADCEDSEPDEPDKLENKLRVIREHILNKKMLVMTVEIEKENEENAGREKRIASDTTEIRVSHYAIVHQGGHYWLIGNRHERPREDVPWNRYTEALTSYRVDKIRRMDTAHTPDEVTIHWTMTKNMKAGKPFTRYGAGRETKARYNQYVITQLERFFGMDGAELRHGEDLDV